MKKVIVQIINKLAYLFIFLFEAIAWLPLLIGTGFALLLDWTDNKMLEYEDRERTKQGE